LAGGNKLLHDAAEKDGINAMLDLNPETPIGGTPTGDGQLLEAVMDDPAIAARDFTYLADQSLRI
jgi:hypothetical protein